MVRYLVKMTMECHFEERGILYSTCPFCNGSGEKWFSDEDGEHSETCSACEGAGHIPQTWLQDYEEHIKIND